MAISVRKGFEEADRAAMAEVYWSAFSGKMGPLLGEPVRARRVIAAAFDPAYCVTARDESGRVIGVCGMEYEGGEFIHHRYATLRREYGPIIGLWRWLLVTAIDTEGQGSTVYISGIGVHPDARGLGVGSAMIDAAESFARERGFETLRLHVVNTNTNAQRLYERLGFRVVGRMWLPFLWWMGFTSANAMVKPVR